MDEERKEELKAKMLENSTKEGSIEKMEHGFKIAKKTHGIDKKQERFILSLAENLGNISATCSEVGISRRTYYDWLERFPSFAVAVNDVNEMRLDILEQTALKKAIEKQDTTMLIFLLKTQASQRGYQEHKRMSVEVTKKQSFKLGDTNLEF